MLTRIDHVGIACQDLATKIAFYESAFGLTVVSMEVNEAQGVQEAMLHVADGPAGSSYIQLLEPLGPDTPVGKFLARRAAGVRLIDERPRHGSMGASIAFLHPADVGGVLTELVQAPDADRAG
jgi:methylmalonyl-CoA/ethylmalonyl-CoA epimerase